MKHLKILLAGLTLAGAVYAQDKTAKTDTSKTTCVKVADSEAELKKTPVELGERICFTQYFVAGMSVGNMMVDFFTPFRDEPTIGKIAGYNFTRIAYRDLYGLPAEGKLQLTIDNKNQTVFEENFKPLRYLMTEATGKNSRGNEIGTIVIDSQEIGGKKRYYEILPTSPAKKPAE